MNGAPETMRIEPSAKRVRAYLSGHLVVDTRRPVLVWEKPYYPTYYLPLADVHAALEPAGSVQRGAPLGEGEVFDVRVSGARAEAGAVRYPAATARDLRDLVRIEWAAMDQWFEEDEPVYVHPRDPYTRVDILESSRHVVVQLGGVVVADSHRPHVLFETGLPPRYYVPLTDVRVDLLRPSEHVTRCPYKGTASYWSVVIDDVEYPDVVWCYRTPLAESQKIAGLACFYDERVDISVDGYRQERPKTPFG